MTTPQISALPDAPSRSDAPATFATKADAFLGALASFGTQVNNAATWIADQVAAIAANTTTASDAAANATAAEAGALAASGVSAWTSGGSYTAGQMRYSATTFQTYRAKTTHSGVATDPASDTTNWQPVTVDPATITRASRRARAFAANA